MRSYIPSLIAITLSFNGCEDTSTSPPTERPSYAFDPFNPYDTIPLSDHGISGNNSTQFSDETGEPAPPGQIYAHVYNAKKNGYNPTRYTDHCLSPRFRMGGKFYSPSHPFARGSGTRLFLTHDKRYVLKTQDVPSKNHREMFWREHAAMSQARHTGVVSVIEPKADLSPMSRECRSRSYVMRKLRGNDLYNYGWLSTDRVLELGKHALKILEKFHDTGVIHGDIHLGNFVLGSTTDMQNSLKLIDFGRSLLYIDPVTKAHKAQSEMAQFTDIYNLNWNILSINELLGRGVSRADDIFRLAECLITLCTRSMRDFGPVSPFDVASQKQSRTLGSKVPQKIQALYRYAMNLGFEERPNYQFLD